MSGTYRTMTGEDFATAVLGGAITMEEIARKRHSVQIGDKITLQQDDLLREKNGPAYIKEKCEVVAKYPSVVIFKRPKNRSGRQCMCSRTWVELCLADRGLEI